jgi:hypothetical protein
MADVVDLKRAGWTFRPFTPKGNPLEDKDQKALLQKW